MLNYVVLAISFILLFFLILPFIMVLFSVVSKEKALNKVNKEVDFACIITVYQNIDLGLHLLNSLLKQRYGNFCVYLVVDNCDMPDIDLNDSKVTILKPEHVFESKVKSIKHAVNNFVRHHEAIVVFDPDNLVKTDFLSTLNDYLNAGYKAVQGRRVAKNLDTIYACADATGEIYKNYIERYAPFILGSSATISGSGIAVESGLYKAFLESEKVNTYLKENRPIVAEDKFLQNFLVSRDYQVAFAKDAILFDEKVSSASQVKSQRSRWLFSYFENVTSAWNLLLKGLKNRDKNQIIIGLTTLSPPLFILLLTSLICGFINLFISVGMSVLMFTGILVFTLNIFLVLIISGAPKQIWKSIWGIPIFVFNQFLALSKMKTSRKIFLQTKHTRKVSLEEVLNET